MIELLVFVSVIILVVVAIKLGKQDNAPAAQPVEQQKTDAELIGEAKRLMLLMEVKRQAELYGDTDTVQAVLNMTYDGPMPDKLPDGTYTRVYVLHDYNIAGINYRDGIADYLGDFDGYLQPDPTNEHDPNAIAVFHKDGHHLGFIPAGCTDAIRALCRPFPLAVTGTIEQDHDDVENSDYFVGTVYLYTLRHPNPDTSQSLSDA